MPAAVLSKTAVLNDDLRTTFTGGKVVMTTAMLALDHVKRSKVLEAVRTFTAFTQDNDPHGEHNCAFFEVDGESYFFKIDCYDPTMQCGSENPEDPARTIRVLTIGTAADY